MKYTLLIYETPVDFAKRDDPEQKAAFWSAWGAYAKAAREAGLLAGGSSLQLPSSATTVCLRNGRRLVQDGPYADTKEQLGGFFVIDVPDLDTAMGWAARCPNAASGVVEVRPCLATGG